MMKTRKPPLRTCVGCGQGADKRELVRVVRSGDGDVSIDPTGKANGRGAYVHPQLGCFEAAIKRGRLAAGLRVTLREEDIDRLRRDLEQVLLAAPGDAARKVD
jgi:uncharacterized protein